MPDSAELQRRTERAQQYFDRHADRYDRQIGTFERRLLGHHRQWATSRAAGSVLELAVGTGLNLPLYGAGVDRVLGVDLSEAMLDHARDRIRGLPLRDRIQVRRGDVQHLDLPDASVDTVVATYALCTVPDPHAVLTEAGRVLRVGGRLLLVEHGLSGNALVRLAQRVLDPLTARWQSDHLLREARRLATGAGFDIVDADQAGAAGIVHRVDARKPMTAPPRR